MVEIVDPKTTDESLNDLWNNAYDCWINPSPFLIGKRGINLEAEGNDSKVNADDLSPQMLDGDIDTPRLEADLRIYMRPKITQGIKRVSITTNPWPVDNLRDKVLYALTGTNPMGIDTSDENNKAANEILERRIREIEAKINQECNENSHPSFSGDRKLFNPSLGFEWWHGFGFNEKWKEHGFILMFDLSYPYNQNNDPFHLVHKLATEFKQGAIYEYRLVEVGNEILQGDYVQVDDDASGYNIENSEPYLKRKTLGVCMTVPPEDVILELVAKPTFLVQ